MAAREKNPWAERLAILGTGAALLWAGMQIYSWLSPPGPDLSVASTYGPFAMPGHALTEIKPTPNDGIIDLPGLPVREITGYIRLSVKNVGDRPAEDTSLRCDYEGFYEVTRDTGNSSDGEFTKKVEIGKIEQNEEATVSIWTFEEVSPRTEILFSHKLGTAVHLFPEAMEARYEGIALAITVVLLIISLVGLWQFAVLFSKRLRRYPELLQKSQGKSED